MSFSVLSIPKAILRYARIPFGRLSGKSKHLNVIFAKKLTNAQLERYFPDSAARSNNGVPTPSQFYMTWAPWLLSFRRSTLYYGEDLPSHIVRFCRLFRIPVEHVFTARPDIPADVLIRTRRDFIGGGGFDRRVIPDWYRPHPREETKAAMSKDSGLFLYIPWIAEHGDTLIGRIDSAQYQLLAFDMMKDVDNNDTRRRILDFARTNPDLYRRMVIARLAPLQSKVRGFIFTFDWAPVMRIIASVCEELDIPTILIPHESVFVDRDKYYWDPRSGASVPICDVILGWGQLQRDIFTERGYPLQRFLSVGAPKFDTYYGYQPKLTRKQLHKLFGLDASRKTILFASQPLDSQLDTRVARDSQRKAIEDLLGYAEAEGAQLIVRLPPSKDDVLGPELRKRLLSSEFGAYDDATCYLVRPEEALYHCDVVTSINSTMLFEGVLVGRGALSMKYVEFDQIWEQAGIPAASNIDEAAPLLDMMLKGEWRPDSAGLEWAAQNFGVGAFDGKAAQRITDYLRGVSDGSIVIEKREPAIDRLMRKMPLDVVAIASNQETLAGVQMYLPALTRSRTVKSSLSKALDRLASADLFLQWGGRATPPKAEQRILARMLGKPVIVVEDGFIRSIDIGLSGAPAVSIIVDELAAHYDATRPSQLEKTIQSGRDLTESETLRARQAIDKIVRNQVSKYNHAPRQPITVGRPGAPKVLVVDQRAGDSSVTFGLASEESFLLMLREALSRHPESDIIIKVHPDAITGGMTGYFGSDMGYVDPADRARVFLVRDEINPYALLDLVDDVYVVSSGMGFEALLAGKTVHCYGAPFYSGWGCTRDHVTLDRRSRRRSVEELFHFAYIEASRYFNPDENRLVEVEEIVDWVVAHRDLPRHATQESLAGS